MGIKKYRMKTILIITAVFPPEPIVSSQLSFDIADKMSEDYKVTVLHPRSSRPYGFSFDKKGNKAVSYTHLTLPTKLEV